MTETETETETERFSERSSERSSELSEHEMFYVLRRRRGFTQAAVAAAAGVHQPDVSGWERGARELEADVRDALWAVVR